MQKVVGFCVFFSENANVPCHNVHTSGNFNLAANKFWESFWKKKSKIYFQNNQENLICDLFMI